MALKISMPVLFVFILSLNANAADQFEFWWEYELGGHSVTAEDKNCNQAYPFEYPDQETPECISQAYGTSFQQIHAPSLAPEETSPIIPSVTNTPISDPSSLPAIRPQEFEVDQTKRIKKDQAPDQEQLTPQIFYCPGELPQSLVLADVQATNQLVLDPNQKLGGIHKLNIFVKNESENDPIFRLSNFLDSYLEIYQENSTIPVTRLGKNDFDEFNKSVRDGKLTGFKYTANKKMEFSLVFRVPLIKHLKDKIGENRDKPKSLNSYKFALVSYSGQTGQKLIESNKFQIKNEKYFRELRSKQALNQTITN